MEKYANFRSYILKSKLGYAGILFFIFLVNRELYCHFFGYACQEELESLVPYLIIIIYFVIIAIILIFSKIVFPRGSKNYKKNIVQVDYAIEMVFYATSIMLLRSEFWYPYLILRIFVYITIDFLVALFVFRNTFSSKQKNHNSAGVRIPFINYLIITILSFLSYLLIISTVPLLFNIFWDFH
jgi:hypothetical protein